MANPIIHSQSSVKRWGGTIDDYITIHEKMDCSKAYLSDNRHRALTHTMFWVKEVMIPIYGSYITIKNKEDKEIQISVKDICEQHILEDYRMKFIPTVQDFLQEMDFKEWMLNGKGVPASAKKLYPELSDVKTLAEPLEVEPPSEPMVRHWGKELEDLKKQQEEVDKLTYPGYKGKVMD